MSYKPDNHHHHHHIPSIKKIECVTICVNYSDFLSHTLPHNKNYFDNMVVVTDTKDLDTKNICDFYNVACIQTDVFYEDDDIFNKAKGINVGLDYLSKDSWVVHLDADIFLPPLTKEILNNIDLDDTYLYGIDRMMCNSYNDWINFLENPTLTHSGWVFVHQNAFPIGSRIAQYKEDGYIPIGFFQMWNPIKSRVYNYPLEHTTAARTDVLFARKFPRKKRALIPEIIAIHLDSEELLEMGKNWEGRKTIPFKLNK